MGLFKKVKRMITNSGRIERDSNSDDEETQSQSTTGPSPASVSGKRASRRNSEAHSVASGGSITPASRYPSSRLHSTPSVQVSPSGRHFKGSTSSKDATPGSSSKKDPALPRPADPDFSKRNSQIRHEKDSESVRRSEQTARQRLSFTESPASRMSADFRRSVDGQSKEAASDRSSARQLPKMDSFDGRNLYRSASASSSKFLNTELQDLRNPVLSTTFVRDDNQAATSLSPVLPELNYVTETRVRTPDVMVDTWHTSTEERDTDLASTRRLDSSQQLISTDFAPTSRPRIEQEGSRILTPVAMAETPVRSTLSQRSLAESQSQNNNAISEGNLRPQRDPSEKYLRSQSRQTSLKELALTAKTPGAGAAGYIGELPAPTRPQSGGATTLPDNWHSHVEMELPEMDAESGSGGSELDGPYRSTSASPIMTGIYAPGSPLLMGIQAPDYLSQISPSRVHTSGAEARTGYSEAAADTSPVFEGLDLRANLGGFSQSSIHTDGGKHKAWDRDRARKLRSEPWQQTLLTVLDSQQLSSVKGVDADFLKGHSARSLTTARLSERPSPASETQRSFTRNGSNQQKYHTLRPNGVEPSPMRSSSRKHASRRQKRSTYSVEQSSPMYPPLQGAAPAQGSSQSSVNRQNQGIATTPPLSHGSSRHNIGTIDWEPRPPGSSSLREIDRETSAGSGSVPGWLGSQGWQKVSPPMSDKSSAERSNGATQNGSSNQQIWAGGPQQLNGFHRQNDAKQHALPREFGAPKDDSAYKGRGLHSSPAGLRSPVVPFDELSVQEELQDSKEITAFLQAKLSGLEEEILESKRQLMAVVSQRDSAHGLLQKCEAELLQSQIANSDLLALVSELKASLRQCQGVNVLGIEEAQQAMLAAQQEAANQEEIAELARGELDEFKRRMHDELEFARKEARADLPSHHLEVAKMKSELEQATKNIERVRQERDDLAGMLNARSSRQSQSELQIDSLKEELAEKLHMLSVKDEQIADMETRGTALLAEKDDCIARLSQEREELQTRHQADLTAARATFEEETGELYEETERLRGEIQTLTASVLELQSRLTKAEAEPRQPSLKLAFPHLQGSLLDSIDSGELNLEDRDSLKNKPSVDNLDDNRSATQAVRKDDFQESEELAALQEKLAEREKEIKRLQEVEVLAVDALDALELQTQEVAHLKHLSDQLRQDLSQAKGSRASE